MLVPPYNTGFPPELYPREGGGGNDSLEITTPHEMRLVMTELRGHLAMTEGSRDRSGNDPYNKNSKVRTTLYFYPPFH
jgi:hypothetical protein